MFSVCSTWTASLVFTVMTPRSVSRAGTPPSPSTPKLLLLIIKSITDSDDALEVEDDERLALAESVINGDSDKVKLILNKKPELIFALVATDSTSPCLNLFDLAVTHRQTHLVETLLRQAERSNNLSNLETFLCKTELVTGSDLVNELIKHNQKIGAKLLNNCINLNNDEQLVNINLSYLVGSKVPETILENGSIELLNHPVNLCATYLKWSQYKHYVFLLLALNILFTLSLSAAVTVQTRSISSALMVLSCVLYLPILAVKSWLVLHTSKRLTARLKTSIEILHLSLFIISVTASLCQLESDFLTHMVAWTVLWAWLRLLSEIHDIPHTSFYVQIFINVFIDIIKFVILLIAVLLGFSLSFHSLLNINPDDELSYLSPVHSFIKVLGMMAGEFNIDSNFHEALIEIQVSTQIIFVLSFLLVSLVFMNITVALAITSLQETFLTRESYKLVRMMICNYKIEQILWKIKNIKRRINLSKYRGFINLLEPFSTKEIFFKINDEKDEKPPTLLASLSRRSKAAVNKVYIKNAVTDEIEPTKNVLHQEILEDCSSILEARRIKIEEELAAEASKCQGKLPVFHLPSGAIFSCERNF